MGIENFLGRMLSLPPKEIELLARDDEIIKGREGRVNYKITKDRLPSLGILFYSVSVSGPLKERKEFLKNLAERIGEPLTQAELPEMPGINFALWRADEVDEKLRRSK